ncbi:hypothetical protein [Natronorarus salvus]|uniref:hypothetical protein n=1 Tax=Natronorarus salvus TaxID=3117733 RepID=UPI002F262FAB
MGTIEVVPEREGDSPATERASVSLPTICFPRAFTEDPESQDWLAEGRRRGRSKSFFEKSDEEREEIAREAEKKAERLKDEQNADGE